MGASRVGARAVLAHQRFGIPSEKVAAQAAQAAFFQIGYLFQVSPS